MSVMFSCLLLSNRVSFSARSYTLITLPGMCVHVHVYVNIHVCMYVHVKLNSSTSCGDVMHVL